MANKISADANGNMIIVTNEQNQAILTANGNLLLGPTSSSYDLDIDGILEANNIILENSSNVPAVTYTNYLNFKDASGNTTASIDFNIYSDYSSDIVFSGQDVGAAGDRRTPYVTIHGNNNTVEIPKQPFLRLNGNNANTLSPADGVSVLTYPTYMFNEYSMNIYYNGNTGNITALVSGVYKVVYHSYWNALNGRLSMVKNTGEYWVIQNSGSAGGTLTFETMLYMNSGDFINIVSNAAFQQPTIFFGAAHTIFTMALIG